MKAHAPNYKPTQLLKIVTKCTKTLPFSRKNPKIISEGTAPSPDPFPGGGHPSPHPSQSVPLTSRSTGRYLNETN